MSLRVIGRPILALLGMFWFACAVLLAGFAAAEDEASGRIVLLGLASLGWLLGTLLLDRVLLLARPGLWVRPLLRPWRKVRADMANSLKVGVGRGGAPSIVATLSDQRQIVLLEVQPLWWDSVGTVDRLASDYRNRIAEFLGSPSP